MKHTKTPWVMHAKNSVVVVDKYGNSIAACGGSSTLNDLGEQEFNAQHIVKCVNLISELEQKGITIKQLEKLANGKGK